MHFFVSVDFCEALEKLCKRSKDGYSNCRKDICHEFKNKTLDELWEKSPILLSNKFTRIIKIRIPNSSLNQGKSGGYRLLYKINKEKKKIVFIYLFPKIGCYGINNIDDKKLKQLIQNTINAEATNSLLKIDFETFESANLNLSS